MVSGETEPMGNAPFTGVRLKDLLNLAGVKTGSSQVQFEGLDRGRGPESKGSHIYLKSLGLSDPVIGETIVAYEMNGEPLPMLNGFPVRLVVPGKFATYWTKALTWIRVLTEPDTNYWMSKAYVFLTLLEVTPPQKTSMKVGSK